MNSKLENYIKYHDNKMKNALSKRNLQKNASNSTHTSSTNNLSEQQKRKLLFLLNYIKKNPTKALTKKEQINKEIIKILQNK